MKTIRGRVGFLGRKLGRIGVPQVPIAFFHFSKTQKERPQYRFQKKPGMVSSYIYSEETVLGTSFETMRVIGSSGRSG